MWSLQLKSFLYAMLAAIWLVGLNNASAQEKEDDANSLYSRLGGLAPISMVVNDFIDVIVVDELLNANPAIDAARKVVPAPYLKYHVTAMVCQATGGPCQYHGRTMKAAHAHLNITQKEWEQMVVLLKGVFDKYEIPGKEQQELMDIVDSTQADIVISK